MISTLKLMLDKFKLFMCDFKGEADVIINLKRCSHIDRPECNLVFMAEGIEWLKGCGSNKVVICISNRITKELSCMLSADSKWSKIDISYLMDKPGIEYLITGIMFHIILRSRVLFHQGIVIHASAIEYDGKGIIFSAPSGTGKSTQASLWEKHMGARVLNDDCPIIKINNDYPHVYGTPCSGSTDKFLNRSVCISAIVVIEQSRRNTIRSLSNAEAISYLMPRCFLAYHDQNLMDMTIDNLDRIISAVPIYLLGCRPDREAVDLMHQCLNEDCSCYYV